MNCLFVTLEPGQVLDISEKITLEGVESFNPSKHFLLTTVAINSDPTLLEWMESFSDDTIEVRTHESVYGGLTSQDHLEQNTLMMESSKDISVLAALEYLGFQAIEVLGVRFAQILPNTAAEKFLKVGDVIVAVDDQTVTDVQSLIELMKNYKPGTTVVLTLRQYQTNTDKNGRNNNTDTNENNNTDTNHNTNENNNDNADLIDFVERKEEIVLTSHPDYKQGLIGVSGLYEATQRKPLPFEINIPTESISGPSAGLAFALAVIDLLTSGNLSGQLTVAATGHIAWNGTVGAVGGVRQKAAAADEAGADIFIVPEGLQAEASLGADTMSVIEVGSLEEAVRVLEAHGGELVPIPHLDHQQLQKS